MRSIRNSKGVVLRVPRTALEENGFHPGGDGSRELVELRLVWASGGHGHSETVFANYYPADRRAEVYLGRLGSAEACQFKVNGTKRYDLACFVEDFNDAKGLNLANLRLGTDGRTAWMEVDGRRIEILDSKLTTFGSMVNLLGTIGKEGPDIKFEYDGRVAVARFKGHPQIELVQIIGDELQIRYAQSKDEKHTCSVKMQQG